MSNGIRQILRYLAVVAATLASGLASADSTVVFVCEHGSSRSLVAASLFNRVAEERGLSVRALSRAASSETVDQKVSPKIAAFL
jgi:hypothetical protein